MNLIAFFFINLSKFISHENAKITRTGSLVKTIFLSH